MIILQLCNKVPAPPKDGGSIASIRLSEGLAKNSFEVCVLAMNTSKHYVDPEILKNYEKENLSFAPIPVNTGINPLKALINLIFSRLPYNAVRFISSEYRKKLIELLHEIKPDLIILENLYPAVYLDDIRNHSDAKIVYRAHNIEHEIWERTANNTKGLKKFYIDILARRIKNFENSFINKYDLLVPITKRDAAILESKGNRKPVFVLPTGYEASGKDFQEKHYNNNDIAHLGALDWHPNQEGLLWFFKNVWRELKKDLPDLNFHIAGRNAPDWFISEMKKYGITYHGEVEDAVKFINLYPIHIVPLLSGSGMRIKIVEAMALGCTVVTTSIGTEGIDTESGKNIVIADSGEAFEKEIKRLVEDRQLCRDIGKNAFKFVNENLDNDKLVAGFCDFLKEEV